jgi:hypothetical protein
MLDVAVAVLLVESGSEVLAVAVAVLASGPAGVAGSSCPVIRTVSVTPGGTVPSVHVSVPTGEGPTGVGELASDLVDDPPDDDQMGVQELPQYLAVLGFVVAFMQTRFHFRLSRVGGKTAVALEVGKEPLTPEELHQVLGIADRLLIAPKPDDSQHGS